MLSALKLGKLLSRNDLLDVLYTFDLDEEEKKALPREFLELFYRDIANMRQTLDVIRKEMHKQAVQKAPPLTQEEKNALDSSNSQEKTQVYLSYRQRTGLDLSIVGGIIGKYRREKFDSTGEWLPTQIGK